MRPGSHFRLRAEAWGSSRPSRTNAAKMQLLKEKKKIKKRPSNDVKRRDSTGRRREQEVEKQKMEVLQRGRNRRTANQAQRRLTNKEVEE